MQRDVAGEQLAQGSSLQRVRVSESAKLSSTLVLLLVGCVTGLSPSTPLSCYFINTVWPMALLMAVQHPPRCLEGTDAQKAVQMGYWWGPEGPELACRKRLLEAGT